MKTTQLFRRPRRLAAVLVPVLLVLERGVLADGSIRDVYPEQARYDPGATVSVTVQLLAGSGGLGGDLTLAVWHLADLVHTSSQSLSLAAGAAESRTFTFALPAEDFRGYFVESRAPNGDFGATAIDVSSRWTRYPRYGYVTEFYAGQSASRSRQIIDLLSRNYHLTGLQFYDWMWRHENVVERAGSAIRDPWTDWRGARISFAVLRDLIAAAHDRSVAAMPYFQSYVGLDGYEAISGVSPAWGLFSDTAHQNQHHHSAGSVNFWVFHPLDPRWQNHLLGEYDEAILAVGFDGVHLDQLGDIGGGVYYDYAGRAVDLGNSFSPLLNRSREHLDSLARDHPVEADGDEALTFNIVDGRVGGFAADDVVQASRVDFLYSEIWTSTTYRDVERFVRRSRADAGGKAIVLAAYVNRDESFSLFDEDTVRLADAAFAAAGAFHLELGDGDQMLGNEFFPSRAKQMGAGLRSAIEDYYDFITAYEELLFAPELTGGDGGLQWIEVSDREVSGDGRGDTIWYLTRRSPGHEVLHLVNLLENDGEWRNAAATPPTLSGLAVKYRLGKGMDVREVHLATPDAEQGRSRPLDFTRGTDSTSDFVSFTVPRLAYWDLIYLRRDFIPPAGGRYEAEDAIKSNVGVNTDHPGYSGRGFVDRFASPNDGVSFHLFAPTDSDYLLSFRYANATGAASSRSLYIDGDSAGTVSFAPLPDWDVWQTATHTLRLAPGVHQAVVWFGASDRGAINLDFVQLSAPANGLKAEYFRSPDLVSLARVRTDPRIDFNWGAGAADPSLGVDGFSVRWSGQVEPRFTETYTFETLSDDGVRLWVDECLLIDNWTDHPASVDRGSVALTAGVKHDLRMEYYERTGEAVARLSWSSARQASEVVPESRLFPPAFEPPAPSSEPFLRGDSNADGVVDVSDAVKVLFGLFLGRPLPCRSAADADDDGEITIGDAVYLLNFLFRRGALPRPPFPGCGADLTPDDLGCAAAPACGS
jgi:dextranase